jgi:hypothetical protein
MTKFSPHLLVMVGYSVLVSDAQKPGLTKLFEQVHDIRLRDRVP